MKAPVSLMGMPLIFLALIMSDDWRVDAGLYCLCAFSTTLSALEIIHSLTGGF